MPLNQRQYTKISSWITESIIQRSSIVAHESTGLLHGLSSVTDFTVSLWVWTKHMIGKYMPKHLLVHQTKTHIMTLRVTNSNRFWYFVGYSCRWGHHHGNDGTWMSPVAPIGKSSRIFISNNNRPVVNDSSTADAFHSVACDCARPSGEMLIRGTCVNSTGKYKIR